MEALGYSRGGLTTKIHCVLDAKGLPIDFKLTGGGSFTMFRKQLDYFQERAQNM